MGILTSDRRAARLWEYWNGLWTFVQVDSVEPTNNTTGRAARPTVLWRKESFDTPNETGSRFVKQLLMVQTTLRQWRGSVVESICARSGEGLNDYNSYREIGMRTMDVVLYKMPIIQGQEAVAEEWMEFLKATPEQVLHDMLSSEKAYYEAYFKNVEQEMLIIYLVFSSEDVATSNEIAFNSNHSVDQKHFDYMRRCVDQDNVQILQSVFQMNCWQ